MCGAARDAHARADGRAVGDDERLLVVTSSFLGTGGAHVLDTGLVERIETEPPVRDAVAEALRGRGGQLDAQALLVPTAPRVSYPGPRPVKCPTGP